MTWDVHLLGVILRLFQHMAEVQLVMFGRSWASMAELELVVSPASFCMDTRQGTSVWAMGACAMRVPGLSRLS
jgi:hypothetical protein